ncbi:multiple sugar transport system permease protein/putative aldouronate transport system permease protein [Paenibacillus castaneae]|uniref:carbohydrate ABC transporter permease n=1 Tax=Paenibacillus castaneae TaxID=474957 RepID=UPI000C9B0BBF|nr:carbohydrate ABC transporter permease [Paenibacillus castaneae]NIK79684.1 multiple sugar transport system permease protein/putative aldouronate transport system permease protein [Paenibacillus castaneae]
MVTEKTFGAKAMDILLVIILLAIGLLCVMPIWYTFALSLSDKAAAAAGIVRLWPIGFNLNAYDQIMSDEKFIRSFGISLQRVLLGATLNFIVVVLTAYPLSKTTRAFRPRNIFMWVLVFTMFFNGGLVPWYMAMKSYGLMNTVWGLVFAGGLQVFHIILVVNFFRNLPKELEEAALVDGAGPWYTLVRLYVPLAVPVLATITLFGIVYHWNEFFHGLVLMSSTDKYPLQTYIQQLVVTIDTTTMTEDEYKKLSELSNQTLNAAKIFIAMIPVLIVYPFLQRFFIHGITLGSVKE